MKVKFETRLESHINPGDLVYLIKKYITYDNKIVTVGEIGLVLGYADSWISGYGALCLVQWQSCDHIMRIYECDLEKIQ